MQPIPVPQNILEAEFKLFGSFTVSQFMKILSGSLISIAIFFVDINPLVKIPLMLFSTGVGFLMAIVPRFSFWFWGFVKSIFISPRYIWVKEGNVPELLLSPTKKSSPTDRTISSAITKNKINIDSLPLAEMVASRASIETASSSTSRDNNDIMSKKEFDIGQSKLYDEYFYSNQANKETSQQLQIPESQQTKKVSDSETSQITKRPLPTDAVSLANEIKRLKFELSKIKRDKDFRQKEETIIQQIAELYREIKILIGQKYDRPGHILAKKIETITDSASGKEVYGIVVDKKDVPISQAKIIFINKENQQATCVTNDSGKFITPTRLPFGDYSIYIEKSGKKFHTYKIVIGEEKTPAYKFREK